MFWGNIRERNEAFKREQGKQLSHVLLDCSSYTFCGENPNTVTIDPLDKILPPYTLIYMRHNDPNKVKKSWFKDPNKGEFVVVPKNKRKQQQKEQEFYLHLVKHQLHWFMSNFVSVY